MSEYRISELAERTGVPATTLRFYEAAGLLPADRTPAGYRTYAESAVERLSVVGAGKRLGLPLADIAELLRVWESGACREVKADLQPRLAARLEDTERRQAELAATAVGLRAAIDRLDALPDRAGPCEPDCLRPLPPATAEDGSATDTRTGFDERWRMAPVACSLSGTETVERVERWRDALVGGAPTTTSDGVRFTVPVDRLAELAELAAAEQACCPFLGFRFDLDGPDLRVEVRATAEGRAVLGELFGVPVS